jgi:3-methyladenine DNA glycosylase AlkC
VTPKAAEPKPARGAARLKDVTLELKQALEQGSVQSRTLMEALAMDFAALLRNLDDGAYQLNLIEAQAGVTRRMQQAASALHQRFGAAMVRKFANHPSDTVRGWAVYGLALQPELTVPELLHAVQPFADDGHFGVREWAWLAVRPQLVAQLEPAISALHAWTAHVSPNVRRFASEALRPRGVWCSHIEIFKSTPSLGLPLLSPLRADSAKYVQDSVANWLNDASKHQPDWVRELCAQWGAEHAGNTPAATRYIIKRALRSIGA